MNERPRLTTGAGALAGGIAGAVVGFADGIRAALLTGTGLRVALEAAILAASVDAVLGVGAGAAAELVARAAIWGRRARPPRWARAVAFTLAGLATAFLLASAWPDLIVGLGIAVLNADAAREVWQAARKEHKTAEA